MVSQESDTGITMRSSKSPLGMRPKRLESRSRRDSRAPRSQQRRSQQLKSGNDPSAIDPRMDKRNVVCPRYGLVVSLRKEGDSDVCCSLDDLGGLDAKRGPSVPKGQMLYDLTYTRSLEEKVNDRK